MIKIPDMSKLFYKDRLQVIPNEFHLLIDLNIYFRQSTW